MLKAGMAGIAVLVLAHVLWIGVLLGVKFHEALRIALFFFPSFAAFLTTYLAPRQKILMGLSMAVYGAVIGISSAFVYKYFGGQLDDIGGPLATFMILLTFHGVYSVVGTAAGYSLSRRSAHRTA
jgi:hypothetical protein